MFERKVLRKTFGPTKEHNGTWRIKTDKELDELIQNRSIINCVKSQGLSWFGHINRMAESSIVKKIYKIGHLEGNFTPVLYMGRKVPKG